MAEQKKAAVAKQPALKQEPKPKATAELTPAQKRLLERYERREALRRKWGMT